MLNRLIPLWDSLCQSAQSDLCANSEDRRSFRTRASAEGLPYISDGLAGLGRYLLDGLRKGALTKEVAQIRFERKENSTLPLFLYSAWSKVFTDDGLGIGATFELDNAGNSVLKSWTPPIEAAVAVRWLRQLTIVFSKMQLPHDKTRVMAVFERFRANEEDLAQFKGRLWSHPYTDNVRFPHHAGSTQPLTEVLLNARRLLHQILCNVDPREISPRHGSGASAERTRPWERYDRILFHPDQNAIWPYLEFATAGKDHTDQILSSEFISDGYPRIARGVFVPKDYRGPRLISCEPGTSMYYQQGLMTKLVTHLETFHQTRGFVNFTNQRINQDLARKGSSGKRELATLDLKDASDRLSWDLVVLLWPNDWRRALNAVRSRVTQIETPQGPKRVPLRKHAPMGSAVCFPVMALTIWCLIKAARFSAGPSKAWIYGDDIIVASRDAAPVCDMLESVGLLVNRDKSFSGASPFRESCGKEYWDGCETTPVYCRYNPDDDDTETASLCAFANNMAMRRGIHASTDLTCLVRELTGTPIVGIPDEFNDRFEVGSDAGLLPLAWQELGSTQPDNHGAMPHDHLLYGPSYVCERTIMRRRRVKDNPKRPFYGTQWEYRVRRAVPLTTPVKPESWGYVLRSSLIGGDLGFAESAPLAKRVQYKYGWVVLDW